MKKRLLKVYAVAGMIVIQSGLSVKAQTVSTFENLTLAPNSYWNGSAGGAEFSSGNAVFPNSFSGGYWSGGWAYSNMKDSTTAGYTNMYSASTAIGYNGSANYILGQQGSKIKLNTPASGKVVSGFYVTNGTYAAISMRDGDSFGKKFGGASGNDPDWFKLTIRKWLGGTMTNDSVEFYLADYRFVNNVQDYIVKTWQWVDLSTLGNVDSLKFILSSSDVGSFGMNTPAFFCMDNFTTSDVLSSAPTVNADNSLLSIFPNPAQDIVTVDLAKLNVKNIQLTVTDVNGKIIHSEKSAAYLISLDVSDYASGIYFVNIIGDNKYFNKKLIKQ